jgi:hypothetical protein
VGSYANKERFEVLTPVNMNMVANIEELTAGGIRCADHATPAIRKSWY